MGATVQIKIANGLTNSPTISDISSGFTFGRDDLLQSATSIPKPEYVGTHFSYYKTLYLLVSSGGGTTSIANRKIRIETSPAIGIYMYFKNGGSSYSQASGVISPDNTASNGYIPAGWEYLSTTFSTWDGSSVSATNNTRNGNYVLIAIGVSNNYIGGAGSSITIPNIILQYDEL